MSISMCGAAAIHINLTHCYSYIMLLVLKPLAFNFNPPAYLLIFWPMKSSHPIQVKVHIFVDAVGFRPLRTAKDSTTADLRGPQKTTTEVS